MHQSYNIMIKDSGSSTITHVIIKAGSRSGSESSHHIFQDLQCNFRSDLFLVLFLSYFVLFLVLVNEFIFSFYTVFVFVNENRTDVGAFTHEPHKAS